VSRSDKEELRLSFAAAACHLAVVGGLAWAGVPRLVLGSVIAVFCVATWYLIVFRISFSGPGRYGKASSIAWLVLVIATVAVLRTGRSIAVPWYAAGCLAVVLLTQGLAWMDEGSFMRDHGVTNPCPRCGKKMKYVGERYSGYTDHVGAGGQGTRHAAYHSGYRCSKCGYAT
jgi:predicted RNA-binding Zn-ribbon protein involved in translation (DUF1610 family)